MDNNTKKVISKNQLIIALNSIGLNIFDDTLTFEQGDFEFEYNLCIDGAGKYVNVILKSKTSIFSMAVEVRLDYFFSAI